MKKLPLTRRDIQGKKLLAHKETSCYRKKLPATGRMEIFPMPRIMFMSQEKLRDALQGRRVAIF
jgi:hypothetical protein